MALLLLLQKLFVYGNLGVLVENYFTGGTSIIKRHWKGTTNSYVWMFPIYGAAGLVLEVLHNELPWPFYLRALVYLPVFFGIEALSGFSLERFTGWLQAWFGGTGGGVVPWDYGKSKWTPMGLINLTYTPFWAILALSFDPVCTFLHKVLLMIVKME